MRPGAGGFQIWEHNSYNDVTNRGAHIRFKSEELYSIQPIITEGFALASEPWTAASGRDVASLVQVF